MENIKFSHESSWLDGDVPIVSFDIDGVGYMAVRYGIDGWAVYFAMNLETSEVYWSHGVDLLGVKPLTLKDRDKYVMNRVYSADDEGITEYDGIVQIAILEYEGQEKLI